jgi:hypothetical protein
MDAMAYRSFESYDNGCDRAERERPVCVSCGQPIWEEKAYEYNGCFYCRDDGCEDDFFDVIREEFTKCIEECA